MKFYRFFYIYIAFCLGFILFGCAHKPKVATQSPASFTQSFAQSKAQLKKVYKAQNFHTEFYCGIDFNPHTLALLPSPNYTPRNPLTKTGKVNVRTTRIEFEHIMPAHRFGKDLECWKNGGRKACARDKQFMQMESDKRNLVPAIGEINADRSNFAYADSAHLESQNSKQYGKCDVYTDFKHKKFYPRKSERGIIARIYLYMSERYNITLSAEEEKLMRKWDKLYPPTPYEQKLIATQHP